MLPIYLPKQNSRDDEDHCCDKCRRDGFVEKVVSPRHRAEWDEIVEQQHAARRPVAERAIPQRKRHHAARDDAIGLHAEDGCVHRCAT